MAAKRTIVVVGSGIVGCAIARELAMRGVHPIVIDPRPVAGGATQASAGMLAPYVEAHERGPLLELGVRSLDLYDDWIASLRGEGQAIEYRRVGTLQVAMTPEDAAELRVSSGDWLEPPEVAAACPQLAPTHGGLRIATHGYVDAPQLARALASSAERRGARLALGRVERIQPMAGALRVQVGNEEAFDVETVILAAGAWANRIDGIPTPPVRPVRGQLLVHTGGIGRINTIVWGPGCYIVPREQPPSLMIGATVEDAGFDERPTASARTQLLDAARALLPALEPDLIEHVRVGLRPATPDGLPVIGKDPEVPGLFHASGHYRNGVLLAPITAQLIADLVLDGAADPALDDFLPERFSSDR